MKKMVVFIFLLLVTVSCNNGRGPSVNNYLEHPVGENRDGKYVLTNLEDIENQWQASLEKEGSTDTLESFEVMKGITQGDEQEDYYILVAKNKSGDTKTAALLSLRDGRFYFKKQQGPESLIYLKIICSGNCPTGCDPIVRVAGNDKFLVCSPCIDCTKAEQEMR